MIKKGIAAFLLAFVGLYASGQEIAGIYQQDKIDDIQQYWVSEKLDGVRGYWDGHHLYTKSGNPINAPLWFTENLGEQALEGELWTRRDHFSEAASIVLKNKAVDKEWQRIHYMIFDMPHLEGDFSQRLAYMQDYVPSLNLEWVQLIPQRKVSNFQELDKLLASVAAKKGEGLVLHAGNAQYKNGKVNHLLKLKLYEEAEAEVAGYIPGKGKYKGLVGSVLVNYQNRLIKIGSGLTDEDRKSPPEIGSTIRFRFNGETKNGLPRFPRLLETSLGE